MASAALAISTTKVHFTINCRILTCQVSGIHFLVNMMPVLIPDYLYYFRHSIQFNTVPQSSRYGSDKFLSGAARIFDTKRVVCINVSSFCIRMYNVAA